jgi:DNA-binding NarL/FixJ family response regulator
MSKEYISLLIVDDHPLFREGLSSIVRSEPDIWLAGEAATGREAVEQCERHRPDVVVMDIQMPDLDGIEATACIRRNFPQTKVVVLTTYEGDIHALRALKAGASAYMLKSQVRNDLLDTIRSVHMGDRQIAPSIVAAMTVQGRGDALTPRETQVLALVATGNTNRLIGAKLRISEATVATHMKSVLAKMAATDRTHAVMLALERGILDFPNRGA